MPSSSPSRAIVMGLYLNVALLGLILAVVALHGGGGFMTRAAYGAPQPQPIAGGGSIFLMPAQFSINTWGCYIMDIDAQTLCAYQFYPGEKQLRLVASRYFHWDRMLRNFNTSPSWPEVQKLTELERDAVRANEQKPASGSPEATKDQ